MATGAFTNKKLSTLTNNLIKSFLEQKFEDSLAKKAINETLIEQKNKYFKMITKLVEIAVKEKEMYSNIIDLVEENKHMFFT